MKRLHSLALVLVIVVPAVGQEPRFQPREPGVRKIESDYPVAPGVAKGEFRTGQKADLMLSGFDFNSSGGPLLFNHPAGLASDGKCLLVCDRNNNRVLVWKSAPAKNSEPDFVLGQANFETNDPGNGLHQLNWPSNVSISPDGKVVAVADTQNDRVLVWKTFPKKSGASADWVVDLGKLPFQPDRSETGRKRIHRLGWPWGVWTDGQKLAVVATHGSAVLIWDRIPGENNRPPDRILTPADCGTPRGITSNGTWFALSDHNYGERSRPATMVWKEFPKSSDAKPDFVWHEWVKGSIASDGKLTLAGMRKLYLYDALPAESTANVAVELTPNSYRNGDGPDVVFANERMYACNYNGNNILVWNRRPATNATQPDFAIGSNTPEKDTLRDNFLMTNPVVATDGKSLFASSDFDRTLYVWKQLPDRSGAKPDFEYQLPEGAWDNALFKNTLVLGGQRSIYIWKELPINGQKPDVELRQRIGSVTFNQITGVALDNQYFYVADREANRVSIWKGIPDGRAEPVQTLEVHRPGRLSSNGEYLAVAPFEGSKIQLYRVADLLKNPKPISIGGPGRMNLPAKCIISEGRMIVADTSNHRVLVWSKLADAISGKAADIILGQKNDSERKAAIGGDRLFMPGSVAFGNGYLWVGEFKFSGRILRFSLSETKR